MLTEQERNTLNEAMAIILANTRKGASWLLSPQNFHGNPGCDVTYFDSDSCQHGSLWEPDCTFADKIAMGLALEAETPGPEARKAKRIERLRKELAELENAA